MKICLKRINIEKKALTKKELIELFIEHFQLLNEKESRKKFNETIKSLFNVLFKKKKDVFSINDLECENSKRLIAYHLEKLVKIGFLKKEGKKYRVNGFFEEELEDFFEKWIRDHKRLIDLISMRFGEEDENSSI